MVAHELLENINMDTMPNMEKGAVLNTVRLPVSAHIHIDIEI